MIIGPMPRYAVAKCCEDPSHITNFNDDAYSTEMAARMNEIAKNIKNLIFTRRLKGVKLVNPIALMGNTGRRPLHSGARTRSTPLNSPTKKWQEKSLGTSAASALRLRGQHCPPNRALTTAQESPAPPQGRTGPHTHSMWPAGEGDGQTNRFPQEPEDPSVATTPGEAAEAATAEATNHTS